MASAVNFDAGAGGIGAAILRKTERDKNVLPSLYAARAGSVGIAVLGVGLPATVLLISICGAMCNGIGNCIGSIGKRRQSRARKHAKDIESAEPAQPAQPTQTTQTTQTTQPAQPAQPAQPTQPAQPAQTTQPAQPTLPANDEKLDANDTADVTKAKTEPKTDQEAEETTKPPSEEVSEVSPSENAKPEF
jgi:hypothetical protein